MIEREMEVANRLGLHARAAAKLVHLASSFDSEVKLTLDGDSVDAKSILGILMLGAAQGTQLTLRCAGSDEAAAAEAITKLFVDFFGEGG
jgi:phosphocarrier protein